MTKLIHISHLKIFRRHGAAVNVPSHGAAASGRIWSGHTRLVMSHVKGPRERVSKEVGHRDGAYGMK